MTQCQRYSLALLVGLAVPPLQAGATLLGDTVDLAAYHAFGAPITGSCLTLQATRAIGAGPELTLADKTSGGCSGAFGVDIDPATGILTLSGSPGYPNAAGNYEYGTIQISGFDDLITSVAFLSDSGLFRTDDPFGTGAIVPNAVISFTGHSIQIDYAAGLPQFVIADGGSATFQITQATEAPEPATLALLALGLAGLGFNRRKPA